MLAGAVNPQELHPLSDDETNTVIPTDLATMERSDKSPSGYKIVFMTRRIADIVAHVQREDDWR
jgi:hypothetical protein